MEPAENRDKVYRALQEALRGDKAKTNILKISELGLVEMTRKRTRENLVQQLCEPCSYCEGRGYVLSAQSVAFKVMREIRKDLPNFCGRQIAIAVNSRVAEMLLGPARKALSELGEELGREIEVRARPGLHQDQFEVTALDEGPPVTIPLRWLEERKPDKDEAEPEPTVPKPEAAAAPVESPSEGSIEIPVESPVESPVELVPHAPEDEEIGDGAEAPLEEAEPEQAESPGEPAVASAQPLDESADSPILPGSPTTPVSEDS